VKQAFIAAMPRWLHVVAALACAAGSAVCWILFFIVYWPYRALFNEQGRYVDEAMAVVYHEQSGVLAIPALILGLLAAFFAFMGRRGRH
jgi:cell division protein FtsX